MIIGIIGAMEEEVAVLKDKVTKLEKENKALERRIADLEKKIK